jgi:hypothetical protein
MVKLSKEHSKCGQYTLLLFALHFRYYTSVSQPANLHFVFVRYLNEDN